MLPAANPYSSSAYSPQSIGQPTQPQQQRDKGNYSTKQIQDYVLGKGWANADGSVNDHRAIWNAAQQYGGHC